MGDNIIPEAASGYRSLANQVPGAMMAALDQAIEEIASQIKFILFIFFLTSIAGMFNAWHIVAVNFYANIPPYWCKVPELEHAGWSPQQIKDVTTNFSGGSSCYMKDWNYTEFVEIGYKESVAFIENDTSHVEDTRCKHFYYDEEVQFSSVVSQWDLVCEKKVHKSNVQGAIAFGKFVGALFLGFIADMIGRKPTFLTCTAIYFVFGVGAALTNSLWVFLFARFCTGIAGAGLYIVGFTLLAEFLREKDRVGIGCMYNLSYPLGFITIPGISMIFRKWRHLQLAISIPLALFIAHFWFLPESPRWLLCRGKYEKAWRVIKRFSKSGLPDTLGEAADRLGLTNEATRAADSAQEQMNSYIPGLGSLFAQAAESAIPEVQRAVEDRAFPEARISLKKRAMQDCNKLFLLFSTWELCKRITISMINFNVASLVYYVLALNAPNFDLDQGMYTFIGGIVSIPGYVLPFFAMMCMGRKIASALLFFAQGFFLLFILFVPLEQYIALYVLSMIGRFTNVAVFSLVTVYCAELFPTAVRNSAIGVSTAMSQLSSIYAPYIDDLLSDYGWYIPSTICSISAFMASAIILMLPETKGKPLLNSSEDVKNQPDRVSLYNCCKCS